MSSDEYSKVADYFVVAGLTDNSLPLEEELAFPNAQHKLSDQRKDPITDICVINKTLGESCPLGFMCIEQTPTQLTADLNHGSINSHNMFLCYKRGKDKPPLIDLGVFYEGLENVRNGVTIFDTTLAGRSANVNNKSGMGSHPIYLTFRRAKESAPQNLLVVTDICIILTNKGEKAPYAFCQIDKNLNKGMIGSSVYVCYKKSMRQVDSISFKADLIARYPAQDTASFPLPATVPLFCLPMGATIECWSKKTRHPLPTFSSFVLTTETSEKIFGAVVSFYENYPEESLKNEQKYSLGLLRGDGQKSQSNKTVHTNKAICFLSRWPLFSSFRDVLMYIYRLTVSPMEHPIPVERHISHFMENVPCPSTQRPRIQYQMSPMHATILTRPQITPIPLSGASFLALLDDLGPENTITLLILALTEHKIVIHSLRPAEITCVAEALITLLFPFKWQCTYVPLCPLEMGYVLEAPCPFIVGVDSRYFDLYEPPPGVTCVNLDTNSITLIDEKKNISWKMLPRKPAKILRSTLQRYFKEVKECPREDSAGVGSTSLLDPDISRTERHRRIDLAIQESVLKLMTILMKGYRQFLKPITEAPNASTTDPSSLFNIQEFIKSRERASQRNFFIPLSGTQLFSSFIEERCLTSFSGGGDVTASRLSSLVFFDECIDRMVQDNLEEVHLIESDESLKSEHTVMIMPPNESGNGEGYQYTTFPVLQDHLFLLGDTHNESRSASMGQKKPQTFAFARRTKQEVRIMQRISKLHNRDPMLWARLVLSHSYGAWFACLPAFVENCRHSDAALRTAYDALLVLNDKMCFPLPDETFYRMLLHLCSEYNKPALAVRVFQFLKKSGVQLSAITYGLYNKAVLEGTWPASNRDGYRLWQKLRNVFLAIRKFRYGLRFYSNRNSGSEISSDFDNTSHNSLEINRNQTNSYTTGSVETDAKMSENSSFSNKDGDKISDDLGDYGYDSMPKEIIKHGTPPSVNNISNNHKENRFSFERSMEPPNTLDIPACDNIHDNGLKSDETIVNQEIGDHLLSAVDTNTPKQALAPELSYIPRASPVLSTKRPLTRTGKLITNNAPSHTNSDLAPLPASSVHETAYYSSNVTINVEECPVLEDNVFNDRTNNDAVERLSPSVRINSGSPSSAVSSLFGADSKFLLSLSDSDQKRHQELCSRGCSSIDSESELMKSKYTNSPVHLRDRSGSLFGGTGGGISPLVGQKSLLESAQLKLTKQPARKNFDNLTADDITSHVTSPIHFGAKSLGSIMTTKSPNKITGVMESPTHKRRLIAKSKEKSSLGNSMMFVGGELMLTSTPLKPIGNEKAVPAVVKQEVERKDISDLLEDPLSPHSSQLEDPLLSASNIASDDKTEDESQNVSRHLVDEIEVYMKREPLVRCSSDAILTTKQKHEESYEKTSETVSSENNLHRKASLPPSPSLPRKHPSISRSLTLDNTSSSWFNSGSKFNNLLKATTIGMATKAKKVAADLAKELNDTVQANIAYYTPEKVKGSLNDLTIGDSQEDVSKSGFRKLLYPEKRGGEQYSSQSSLRSRDSVHSNLEPRSATLGHNDKVLRRTAQKNAGRLDRPLSMPPIDSKSSALPLPHPPVASSFLSIPGNRDANASSTSLNKKDVYVVDVTISSCSKCHGCKNLVYDEEIMAGWNGDDSNLNTHCPFCNHLFVPFLNIEVQYPDTSQELNINEEREKTQESSNNVATRNSQTSLPDSLDSRGMFLPSHPTNLEPVAVPYLSSLVLRKELESLLENEGSSVISTPGFVDHHPIIYWNLVWYFKRLHVHSNLYNLLLQSSLVKQADLQHAKVNICLMWDNLKLHIDAHKPPMYCVWHQLITLGNNNDQPYSYSLLSNVKDGIMQDDVRGPLVAVLNELHVQKGVRRSAYREILFLIIVALGKNSIDIGAFDREYKRAYDALTAQELSLTLACDRPPNNHAIDCRDLFGELDLYK